MSDVSAPIPPCPHCSGTHIVRNGHNRSGTANFLCRGCGRHFVARPKKGPVPDATRDLVRRFLRERMALRAIARATDVSQSSLQQFVNALYREVTPPGRGSLKERRAS